MGVESTVWEAGITDQCWAVEEHFSVSGQASARGWSARFVWSKLCEFQSENSSTGGNNRKPQGYHQLVEIHSVARCQLRTCMLNFQIRASAAKRCSVWSQTYDRSLRSSGTGTNSNWLPIPNVCWCLRVDTSADERSLFPIAWSVSIRDKSLVV